jgi:hypothetical protein
MNIQRLMTAFLILLSWCWPANAQTTIFSYQGKLTDAGNPANGNYDLQFKLFDTVTVGTGTQQGATLVRNPVVVSAGIFTVTLDFGANVFNGIDRFLEIGVRQAGSGNPYTTLAPRQPITSSPYAIQTLNAQQLGGLPASGFVQNTTTAQAGANFNVGGTGTVGSLNINNTLSLLGSGAPATAPAGQGRLYFDAMTNKLKVSESGGAFVNLVGATGVSGSGTVNTIPLWSAGTTLGNSLITQTGASIQLPNTVQLGVGAQGNQVQFGSPNSETGMSISGASGRADLRFDGTLKLVNGPGGIPPATNGLAITSAGNVGIGTTTPTTKLTVNAVGYGLAHIGGPISLSSYTDGDAGWFGTRSNHPFYLFANEGVRMAIHPNGNVGIGTLFPTAGRLQVSGGNQTAIYAGASIGDVNSPAVRGVSTGAGGVGVRGDGTTGVYGVSSNGAGVTGEANASGGTGVYGTSTLGYAVYANGNAGQVPNKGGFVKAMLHVASNGTILRCYNGVTGASTGTCGFSVNITDASRYNIGFGFQANNRFASVVITDGVFAFAPIEYGPLGLQNNIAVQIRLPEDLGSNVLAAFTIIVY